MKRKPSTWPKQELNKLFRNMYIQTYRDIVQPLKNVFNSFMKNEKAYSAIVGEKKKHDTN